MAPGISTLTYLLTYLLTYRKLPTPFRTVPSPTPYGLLPKIGVSQLLKTSIAIISATGKATDFKFGRYIHRVHPNKSPLKNWTKRGRGHIQRLPKFLEYPLLSQERVKRRTSYDFARAHVGSIGTKAHLKFREK